MTGLFFKEDYRNITIKFECRPSLLYRYKTLEIGINTVEVNVFYSGKENKKRTKSDILLQSDDLEKLAKQYKELSDGIINQLYFEDKYGVLIIDIKPNNSNYIAKVFVESSKDGDIEESFNISKDDICKASIYLSKISKKFPYQTDKFIKSVSYNKLRGDNYFEGIGAESFFDCDDNLYDYIRCILNKKAKRFEGYKYDFYYIYDDANELEYWFTLDSDLIIDYNNPVLHGFNIHYCSNSVWPSIKISKVLSNDGINSFCIIKNKGFTNDFPVKITNADVIEDIHEGEEITAQVVAFSTKGKLYSTYKDWAENNHDLLAMGTVSGEDGRNDSHIIGQISFVDTRKFEFKNFISEFYEIVISTTFGNLTILSTEKILGRIPKIGELIDCYANISMDPSIDEYQNGKNLNDIHMMKLIKKCIREKNFDRLTTIVDEIPRIYYNGEFIDSVINSDKVFNKYYGLDFYFSTVSYFNEDKYENCYFVGSNSCLVHKNKDESKIVITSDGINIMIDTEGNIKEKDALSEDEMIICDAMHYANMDKMSFIGIFTFLKGDKIKYSERVHKLAEYISFKGKYIDEGCIFAKCHQICKEREQHYPFNMYVKYTGDTTTHLTKNKIYNVRLVLDIQNSYIIEDDTNYPREYNAEKFETQKITEFIYTGYEDENGLLCKTDGFEIGKEYKVLNEESHYFICDNGLKCFGNEIVPTKFEPQKIKKAKAFNTIDDALNALLSALEFGNFFTLSNHLDLDCQYISVPGKKSIKGKKPILDYLQKVANAQLEKNYFLDCCLGTISETNPANKYPEGTRCIVIMHNNVTIWAFIELSDDFRYIEKIYLLQEPFETDLDGE